MEITTGTMLFFGGIAGAAVCLIILLATGPIFHSRKKRLLERLQDM